MASPPTTATMIGFRGAGRLLIARWGCPGLLCVVADEGGGKVHRDPHGPYLGDDVGTHPVVLDELLADLWAGAALLLVGGPFRRSCQLSSGFH